MKLSKEQNEYIANEFRRSEHKKYENLILPRLYWLIVDKFDVLLKFTTQQTVFIDNGNHVYLDGYFSDLNIGIEVDEQYHKHQKEKDKKRENDIIYQLGQYHINNKPIIYRFDVTKDINEQIYECADIILNKYNELGKPQWIIDDNINIVKNGKTIRYNDNLIFKYKHDLVNALGLRTASGKEYSKKGTQSISAKNFDDEHFIWFPCITDNNASGWENNYDSLQDIFTTHFTKPIKRTKNYWYEEEKLFKSGKLKKRYIIFKVIDCYNNKGYKYYGEYECIMTDAKKQISKWKRISTKDLKIKI
jgi:very-short-patch-repair endonuclease